LNTQPLSLELELICLFCREELRSQPSPDFSHLHSAKIKKDFTEPVNEVFLY